MGLYDGEPREKQKTDPLGPPLPIKLTNSAQQHSSLRAVGSIVCLTNRALSQCKRRNKDQHKKRS
jgi:hypothetical protein